MLVLPYERFASPRCVVRGGAWYVVVCGGEGGEYSRRGEGAWAPHPTPLHFTWLHLTRALPRSHPHKLARVHVHVRARARNAPG